MDFPFLSYCRVMESTWIHKAKPVCHVFGRVLPKCPLGGADGLKCLKYLWAIYSHLTMCSPCMKKVRKFQVSEFWVLYFSQPDISRFTPRLVWTILDFWQSAVTWECMASRPGLDQFQQVPGPCFWLCMTQKSFWITSKQFEKNKQITLKTKKHTSQYRFEVWRHAHLSKLLPISNTLFEVSWSRIHPQDSEVSCPKSPAVKKSPVGCVGFLQREDVAVFPKCQSKGLKENLRLLELASTCFNNLQVYP